MRVIETKQGTFLVSAALALPVFSMLASGMLFLNFLFFAKALMHLDLYRLARSHLYEHARNFCDASQIWPKFKSLSLHYECSGKGKVSGTMSVLLGSLPFEFQDVVNLEPGARAP
jgi:hypothetical protein